MPDILEDLKDLHKQATTERSHYYVAKCCERAMAEIDKLRHRLNYMEERHGRIDWDGASHSNGMLGGNDGR